MRLVDGVTVSNRVDNQLTYGSGHHSNPLVGDGHGDMPENLMSSSLSGYLGDGCHGQGNGNGHCAAWEYHLFGGDQPILTLIEAWENL